MYIYIYMSMVVALELEFWNEFYLNNTIEYIN